MDRNESLNSTPRSSNSDSSPSPGTSTSMKKKKKLKRVAASKKLAILSSEDEASSFSSEDIVSRPQRRVLSSDSEDSTPDSGPALRPRSGNLGKQTVLCSSSSDSQSVTRDVLPSTSSRFVNETPSTSNSSSPIMLPRRNLVKVIGSEPSSSSTSPEVIGRHPRRRVVHISETPSTSSGMQSATPGGAMSSDDDGPIDMVRTNRPNKLSSTESSEDEDCPSCAICLSSLANRIAASISGCSHEFHNTCILKWSERINTCPIDRSKFNKITVRNKEGKIVKVTEIDDKNAATADDEEQPFPDEAVNCVICGSPDNEDVLLLCDGCNRGFHIFCLDPPLDSVPEGNWICDHCSPVLRLTDSMYFNDELDISIEDYSDNSNASDVDMSSNEISDDAEAPSTSRRRSGRYRTASLTVSVSSRNQNLLRNTRVRQTTITIKQTRRRKRRTRRSRRRTTQTVSQRSRVMAAAVAKRSACQARGNTDTRQREKTLRSEPGRPRLSLFSSDNFEDYYNPESDGDGGGQADVAVAARSRYATPRLMDRKAAVARLVNSRRSRMPPRVSVAPTPSTTSSVNVLDDIMGMMEVENRKSTGSIPIKKDGTFAVPTPAKVDVNDSDKEKVTETPGYPGAGTPNRGRGFYNNAPTGGNQAPARHQSGVFTSRPLAPPFTPRFSPFPGGRSHLDSFHAFRSPQPRFRPNSRRFPSRRSLPASLLMEPEAEDTNAADEDVDIYGDIDSSPLVSSSLRNLEPPPQPPAALFDLGPPPEPPAALLSIGSPEEGPSDEEKGGLVIDDNEYDPADPCDSPEPLENPPSIPSDSSSDELDAIPIPPADDIPVPEDNQRNSASPGLEAIPIPGPEPPVYSCAPRPGNYRQSDSDEDCPNSSLYSSKSLALARNKAKSNDESDSDHEHSPPTMPQEEKVVPVKSGPIRFSIGTRNTLSEQKKVVLFSDDDSNDSNDSTEGNNESKSINENQNEKVNKIEEEIEDENVNKISEDIVRSDMINEDIENENEGETVKNDKSDDEKLNGGVVVYASSDEDNDQIENPEENVSQDSEMKETEAELLDVDSQEKPDDAPLEKEDKEDSDDEEAISQASEPVEVNTSSPADVEMASPKDDSFELSPDKAQAEKSLEDEIFGSEKGDVDVELDKDEVSTQGDILDLNTENLQGVTDTTARDVEHIEEDTEDARTKSDFNALDGLDVDPVSESEYGSLSDREADDPSKTEKKKKKKRKNTDREEGEIVEPKKKERKKERDENSENGLSDKRTKKKKDRDFELSPLQEKIVSNNIENSGADTGDIAWKKLSKNTKDRNYRDKDETSSRKRKEARKELERYNVRKIVGEKAFIRKDEFGRDISVSRSRSPSFGKSPPPRRRSKSPRKRSLSRDRLKSPGRKIKKRRSRSKSFDRFRKRSLSPRKRSLSPRKRSPSPSPVRRKRTRSPSIQKAKDRKIQKRGGRTRSRSRRRSRTPRKVRSRSRSKPKKRSRSRDKGKAKLKKDKPVEAVKSKDGKKKKKKQPPRSPVKRRPSRSPRGRSPWDFSSTSISRSPSPPATFTRKSRSWSREKNLTVIVPNTNKKKEKKKSKANKQRKHKDDHSPTLSKEVFTSGDNILVSVNFAHAEKSTAETTTAKVDKVKSSAPKRSKKDIQAMKAAKVKEMANKAKPVAIIDLDVSPFRERTPSPKEVIVLCDSDSETEANKVADMKAISSGPKTPPEPHIKFSINAKNQAINTIANPLMDIEDKQGPNTPPDPPSPQPTSPYDPFDPTKSRSPSPTLQSAPNDSIEMKTPNDNLDKNQLDLLKPAATPSKDSTQSPSKVISVVDDNSSGQMTLSKQDDKLVTSSMASSLQSSVPVYTSAINNGGPRNAINGAEAMEDILNIDSDDAYSPGSSLGDDLFDPPKKSPPQNSAAKKFDSLFVPKNATVKSIPYEPKHTKPPQSSGTPKKNAPKYTPTKAKAKPPPTGISKLDEDQLKILDEVPSSAVEMQVKYKYLKKLNRQERVVEEVKIVLKPHYNKKHVTKEQYKDILRKAVPKICHNKSGEINPIKIHALIEAYVKKYRIMNKKKSGGNAAVGNSMNNGNANNVGAKKTKTMWN